jgi:hypothetical protein
MNLRGEDPLVRSTLGELKRSARRGFAITRRNLLRRHQRKLHAQRVAVAAHPAQLQRLSELYPKVLPARRPPARRPRP